jgi:hypothetical protein
VYLHEPAEGYCLCFYFGESPILDDEEKLTRVIQTGERLVVGWGGQSKPSSVASPRKVKMDISKLGQGTFPTAIIPRSGCCKPPDPHEVVLFTLRLRCKRNMPKRSNYFQRLVLLVRNHIAAGATVTESAELIDKVTGAKREVDICIEGTVGGVPTIVSIECRAFMRKADVTWVEEMTHKHNDLPTDVLILYSRSGFTKAAVDKAKFYNKRIVALRTLNDATAEGLFGGAGSLWVKTCTLTPTKIIFRVPESDGLAAENVSVFPDNILFNHSGQPFGIVKDWVELMLHSPAAMPELLKRGDQTHKGFEIRTYPWDPPLWEGKSFCLQKNDQEPPILRPVETVTVLVNQTSMLASSKCSMENWTTSQLPGVQDWLKDRKPFLSPRKTKRLR